jgi:hypothetical protein
VLVEHRIHDVDEGLVAGEEAVAAGEQIALQPALALCSLNISITRPSGCDVVVAGENLRRPEQRSVTSNTAPQRLEFVSSGLKTRKLTGCRFITSRMNSTLDARGFGSRAGFRHRFTA